MMAFLATGVLYAADNTLNNLVEIFGPVDPYYSAGALSAQTVSYFTGWEGFPYLCPFKSNNYAPLPLSFIPPIKSYTTTPHSYLTEAFAKVTYY
jgi:hypothetical protein